MEVEKMVQDLELIAQSAEAMPAGDYATLDVYTSGAMAMYCTWCIPHQHETRKLLGMDGVDKNLLGTGSSFKIFEGPGAPLVRYDLKPHEFGSSHLQYGANLFTGRVGNEAADIFATLLKNNPKINFP